MAQYAFYFDGTRCTGCKTCQMACKDYKDLTPEMSFRKVYEVTFGDVVRDESGCFANSCVSYTVSMSCNHCDEPVCVKVCPTTAMHKDPETGLVSVDASKCIGCGYCHMACLYNAPKVDRSKGHSVKCDGCADLVAKGEAPVCVLACPARALRFGSADELSMLGERGNIAPLPEPTYTNPNVFIKPCSDALPAGDMQGKVTNPLEVI